LSSASVSTSCGDKACAYEPRPSPAAQVGCDLQSLLEIAACRPDIRFRWSEDKSNDSDDDDPSRIVLACCRFLDAATAIL
jgi:hypothetical protein